MERDITLLALSSRIPREDITTRPFDADATAAAIDQLWPGRYRPTESTTLAAARWPEAPELCAALFGDTLLISADETFDLSQSDAVQGDPREPWMLTILPEAEAVTVETPEVSYDVSADTDPGDLIEAISNGIVLPFAAPYAAGEHPESGGAGRPFAPLDFGAAALAWVFGIEDAPAPQDAAVSGLAVLPIADVPMQRFTRA